ncbi:MAG: hypothetical protein EKK57_07185 [Proteobacteria bacterium]|nr:MAG: hypothetical protein EKK57_07185 [Pseudomonadota bacterium]
MLRLNMGLIILYILGAISALYVLYLSAWVGYHIGWEIGRALFADRGSHPRIKNHPVDPR